jgi:hypothetical protein
MRTSESALRSLTSPRLWVRRLPLPRSPRIWRSRVGCLPCRSLMFISVHGRVRSSPNFFCHDARTAPSRPSWSRHCQKRTLLVVSVEFAGVHPHADVGVVDVALDFVGFRGNHESGHRAFPCKMAEGVGFEPTEPFGSPVFKTGAIDHSTTPPVHVCGTDMGALGAGFKKNRSGRGFFVEFSVGRARENCGRAGSRVGGGGGDLRRWSRRSKDRSSVRRRD